MTQALEHPRLGVNVAEADEPRMEFGAFFDAVWPDLLAFCRTLSGSDHAAEELTQETLTRVFARYPLLSGPRPYAFRVAANLVRRTWKDGQRLQVTDPGLLPDEGVQAPTADTIDAVRRLPERLRIVVMLHYYADQPVEVVARSLHRPTGTIKRRLHEARALLAEMLKEDVA